MASTLKTRFAGGLAIAATAFAAGVLADNATESLFVGGDVVFDSSKTGAPSLVYDSGSYLTYTRCAVGSGITTNSASHCTTAFSGASAGSNLCTIANPFDGTSLPFSGSGSIWRYQLDVVTNPADVTIDIGTVRVTTASGNNIADNLDIGSGSSFVWTGSGNSVKDLGGYITPTYAGALNQGYFIKATAGKDPTSNFAAHCKAWLVQNDAL